MKKKYYLFLLLIFLQFKQGYTQTVEETFEDFSIKIEYLSTYHIIYNRCVPYYYSANMNDVILEYKLYSLNVESAELIKLLKHKNPKIRTLAVFALLEKQNPKYLSHIVELVADSSQSFQRVSLKDAHNSLALRNYSVGEYASEILYRILYPSFLLGNSKMDFNHEKKTRKNKSEYLLLKELTSELMNENIGAWRKYRLHRFFTKDYINKKHESKILARCAKPIKYSPELQDEIDHWICEIKTIDNNKSPCDRRRDNKEDR